MRPQITLLTSSELQKLIGADLDEEAMAELQGFRDDVGILVKDNLEALDVMAELYGREWLTYDVDVWIYRGGLSISSPICIDEESVEAAAVRIFQMLAKRLIRHAPADSELTGKGLKKIDALSGMLATESLRKVMEEDRFKEVIRVAREETDKRTVKQVTALEKEWDPDTNTMHDWLEGR